MKHSIVFALTVALLAACSTKEVDFLTHVQDDVIFYASFEQPAEVGTRVYANEDLLLRWTTDDRVSIFNKITYNHQYKFIGETGDAEGGFSKVDNPEFMTGDEIPHVVSVYPFRRQTEVSADELITLMLPANQPYTPNSFGLGANTMVSVSSGNLLKYKNVGGYLVLNLYGEGYSVSSITLKGNNGEKIAGKASITMPLNGAPTATMADEATTEITLISETPVQLGATAEDPTRFWFVVPPVTFEKGFTITIDGNMGRVFQKKTTKSITIERNSLSKMAPIEVDFPIPNNVILYTSSDGEVVTPYNPDAFGASILSNEYVDGWGVLSFDGDVTSIGARAFSECGSLTSVTIPDSVTSIGNLAFYDCISLTSVTIPDSVTSIGDHAFGICTSLTSIMIPDSVTSLGNGAFAYCYSLTGITIPESVEKIGKRAFFDCTSLMSFSGKYASQDGLFLIDSGSIIAVALGAVVGDIAIPIGVTSIDANVFAYCSGLTSIMIPDSVTSIGDHAFLYCTSLTSVEIPDSVTSIGEFAFLYCTSLTSVTVKPETPPTGGLHMLTETNNAPIYVPVASVDAYKAAEYWSDYADRIYAIPSSPVPKAVDLGLPSGLKWASFNLGSSKPEKFGDYYAWGEIEPYYSSQDPLIWKEGKEEGYGLSSYNWCMGDWYSMTKYCSDSSYGYNGFTDTKVVLDLEDDAAHVILGGNWRMPTYAEWVELMNNCTLTWTKQNGVNGRQVTGPNGNSIFLPAAGCWFNTDLCTGGSYGGFYWSSSLGMSSSYSAWYVNFDSENVKIASIGRCDGFSVRPVCE